jgi:phage baseplate assembly protein V
VSYSFDREMAPILRRIDMMLSRGVLRATTDSEGVQTMQMTGLEGEVIDDVERFQSYGVSSVPPPGGDALIGFVSGNRDHGVVLAVNDRTSRPKGIGPGEVVLYNDQNVLLLLDKDGDLRIRARRIVIEADETIDVKAGEKITLVAPEVNINPG